MMNQTHRKSDRDQPPPRVTGESGCESKADEPREGPSKAECPEGYPNEQPEDKPDKRRADESKP